MKLFLKFIIILVLSTSISAREKGETEITTEDGIEVFQNQKYYLLKKNVTIISDAFSLNADDVKINFDKSLYDIVEINAEGNVDFKTSEFKMAGNGERLKFEVNKEKLKVEGIGSELITTETKMYSDGYIEVSNIDGNFSLEGSNSRLINESILIEAKSIKGIFSNIKDNKEVIFLNVFDKKQSYVKNNETEMYANNIIFDKEISLIELIDNVIIIRDGEKITGDYGTLDTKNNSYKIKSNDQTKVKVIIQNDE